MGSRCLAALAAGGVWAIARSPLEVTLSPGSTTLLPFQPSTMFSAQLAAVSYLARYSGTSNYPRVPAISAPGAGNPSPFNKHAGVGVEQFQLAVGDQVADDERALPYSPESFSALKIGQFALFSRREAEDVGGVWGFG